MVLGIERDDAAIAVYARLLWQLLLWLRRDDPPDPQ